MSEAKLISPMLDGFAIGGPISDHHGVRCYPAMPKDSDKRYIVKVISIPASQVQLDALLLAGAYTSQDSALAYFRELAEGVAAETDVLKKLSRFEGFIPFEDLQIVPKDDNTGYDVYLLSSYKRSLDRHMRKKPMTHLNAVNLGLDLCASMVVCRRAGYLYVDLKPTNIYINEKQEFRIGDLGFVKLDSLQYTSLPDKYRSPYTAPEISDAWSSLNDTLDTYAIGMILYQVYNDGKLPFDTQAGTEELPPPLYADYEMAEIILKAIAPDPSLRWADPMLMGQALVAYMQRNTVNDVSIVPLPGAVPPAPVVEAPVEEPAPEEEPVPVEEPTPVEESAPAEESAPTEESVPAEETAPTEEFAPVEEPTPEEEAIPAEEPAPVEEPLSSENADDEPVTNTSDADDDAVEVLPALVMEEEVTILEQTEPTAEESAPAEDELTDLSFMDDMPSDETTPDAHTEEETNYDELSEELSDMLSLADELIALEMPEPVVAPEPIEIPIPAPIILEDEPEETVSETAEPLPAEGDAVTEAASDSLEIPVPEVEFPAAPVSEIHEPEFADEDTFIPEPRPHRWGGIIAAAVIIALLAGALFGGYYYYQNFYLQTVDSLHPVGDGNDLVVIVDSQVDNSLLTVVCTDTYGNTRYAAVVNGKATFENLDPDTIYQIKVVIEGFHQLKGDITDDYTTPAQTTIVRFDAVAGSEEGSAVLNFTIDGKDSDTWTVTYQASGEDPRSVTFSGHLVTVAGLSSGKEYTFTLTGKDGMYIVGADTVTFTPAALVYAENLDITSCNADGLTAVWSAPEGVTVDAWVLRCYNDAGYDVTVTVSDLTYTFTGIDPTTGYTVEVIAQGMSVGVRDYVSPRSATITGFTEDHSIPLQLTVTWDYTGTAPETGWLVLYSLRDSEKQDVVQTTENRVTISSAMPGGTYDFVIQATDGTTVFNGTYTCTAKDVEIFSGYGVTAENMTLYMVRRPNVEDWDRYDLSWSDYTNTYAPGENVSILIQMNTKYNTSNDLITSLFVVRDMDGNLICTSSSESSWVYMWHQFYCELDVPAMPTTPGEYYLNVYFNSQAVARLQFTIEE